MATTLTRLVDEEIEAAVARGETPDYKQVAEEVLEGLKDRPRKEATELRKEALELGVTLRARYRLRAHSQSRTTRRRSR